MAKKSFTNHAPGPRGINLKNKPTLWLESGETADVDSDEIVGGLPDFGKPADQSDRDADELVTLRERVEELEAENAALRESSPPSEPTAEPGPLDQSVEKLIAYLEGVSDADEVEQLIAAEKGGKSRTGAITALEARRDAILAA